MSFVRVVNEVCGLTVKEVKSGQSGIIRVGHGTVIALHVGCIGQPSVAVGIRDHTHAQL